MTTLAAMKARIAAEISRSDLTEQIATAINDSIAAYQGSRFFFSDISPAAPVTFNTVIGQSVYGAAASPYLNTSYVFDRVWVMIGNVASELVKADPSNLTIFNQQGTMQGDPTYYAYQNGSIILSPTPSAVRTITLNVLRNVAAPAADDEAGNPWMTDAEPMIRARAKFEIATHVTRNPQMAQAMSPEPPELNGGVVGAAYRAERNLKAITNRLTGTGVIESTQF